MRGKQKLDLFEFAPTSIANPIPQFSPTATLGTMRKETGKTSVEAVRRAAANLRH
jgi:hypothetical protein